MLLWKKRGMILKYLMCNLKSNKTVKEILDYKKSIAHLNKEEVELVLFPSALYLPFFYEVPYKVGSQNLSIYDSGSHTGEILAKQLKSLKVSYVLINHFEAKETQENTIAKIKNATRENIQVVFCIGEKTRQTMDESINEMKREIHKIFDNLTEKEIKNILLAYEPCWAINGKDIINTKIINNIAEKLKKEIDALYHTTPPILYGGGITTKNIKDLTNIDNIDGYLLGNCANTPENICKIFDNL